MASKTSAIMFLRLGGGRGAHRALQAVGSQRYGRGLCGEFSGAPRAVVTRLSGVGERADSAQYRAGRSSPFTAMGPYSGLAEGERGASSRGTWPRSHPFTA